jgi:hypothetical protein
MEVGMLPRIAIVAILSMVLLAGCQSAQPTATVQAGQQATTLSGTVADFLVTERPRVIIFVQPANGISRIILDENAQGELKTRTVSKDNCPLAGPPLQAGDQVEVKGRVDTESGNFIAEEIKVVSLEAKCQP